MLSFCEHFFVIYYTQPQFSHLIMSGQVTKDWVKAIQREWNLLQYNLLAFQLGNQEAEREVEREEHRCQIQEMKLAMQRSRCSLSGAERTIDGMINIKATFLVVLHNSLHFDVFKLDSVCQIPYMVQLCVCYRLNLTLDGFINDLYEQSIFCFNGCLNASFIMYCLACNYCLKPPSKALQYGLSA